MLIGKPDEPARRSEAPDPRKRDVATPLINLAVACGTTLAVFYLLRGCENFKLYNMPKPTSTAVSKPGPFSGSTVIKSLKRT